MVTLCPPKASFVTMSARGTTLLPSPTTPLPLPTTPLPSLTTPAPLLITLPQSHTTTATILTLTPNTISLTPWLTPTPVTTSPSTRAATVTLCTDTTPWLNLMVPSARLSTLLMPTMVSTLWCTTPPPPYTPLPFMDTLTIITK
ncbi:unnamed protein product [Spodoptera littoralis]|uniref:Uncharacterized protein n=1 Tax=Spodoptera littoralis TaxID=7109 RepID=A0A9P0ICV8_SPOLI|nr:unnamed protein product [Spodoptera littoralis]CAH1644413.1 unnamed protein product [Spodoptera littoralis]